jgi:hypothetical protein
MANRVFRGTAFEDQPAALRHRVTARDATGAAVAGEDGFVVLQADVASVAWAAYAVGELTQATAIATGTVAVATAVYDTLQSWKVDATGFNLQVVVPASVFADRGNEVVRVVITVTLSGGTPFNLVWDLLVQDVTPN